MTALARTPGRTLTIPRLILGFGLMGTLAAPVAFGDQFHYNNVLIGTRAVGMGGAFGAVADDASGVYYNPAGLAFALSNDISGSANAFYQKETTYKEAIGGDDFVEESSGSVPSFFGGLQKLDRYVDGLVFAFGVYSVDSDMKDQNTLLEGLTLGSGANTSTVERYHRTSNARASTNFMGAAVGMRVTSSIALGFGLSYFSVDELVQEYQHVVQSARYKLSDDSIVSGWKYYNQNLRQRLQVHGVQASLGAQMALPGNTAVGLTIKPSMIASQRLEFTNEVRTNNVTDAGHTSIKETNRTANSPTMLFSEGVADEKLDKPMGTWPTEVRLGFAWFATPNILWTLDASHYTASADADKLFNKVQFPREAVTNLGTGLEYYLTASLPLRMGIFTNNDARPEIKDGEAGQPDHVDYMGESLFIAWVQPNSQIAAGVVLQQGKGEAQKTGDAVVQDVTASATTFAFSATHNL
jgi:hypothetical protein